MVGETQARPFAQNTTDLLEMLKERKNAAKQKATEARKMIVELERDLAEYSGQETAFDTAIYELEHMGEHAGPKKRKRTEEEEDER